MDFNDFMILLNNLQQIKKMFKKIPKSELDEVFSKFSDKEKEDLLNGLKMFNKIVVEMYENLNSLDIKKQ